MRLMSARTTASRRAWLAAVGSASAAVAGAYWLWGSGRGTLEEIRRNRRVRVGYSFEAPYTWIERDRVTGACAETTRLIAARLGWNVEWVQTRFEDLIGDLLDHRFDIVSAGLFVSPARALRVRFALPELRVAGGLLVRSDNARAPHSYAELQQGRRVAAIGGSVELRTLQQLRVEPTLGVPDAEVGAKAVETGTVDALALSWPSAQTLAAQDPRLKAIRVSDHAFLVASAFRPADARLADAWNATASCVLRTPERLRAIAPFGFGPADVPGEAQLHRCTS